MAAALAACGGGGSNNANSAVDAGGVCGTFANPGILRSTTLSPAMGSSVVNGNVVHRFVVENAPAVFTQFTLKYGPGHTAGLSTPAEPTITVTPSGPSGSTLLYQVTVDAWSQAPGHVELVASNGYETSKKCYWVFPSPLFSYDIAPALDGGVAGEAGRATDGGGGAGSVDGSAALDAAAGIDVPAEMDVSMASAMDAAID